MKKRWKLFLILVATAFILCIAGGWGYLLLSRYIPRLIIGWQDAARPTVMIFVPQHGQQLAVASTVSVQVQGRVPRGQVVLLQLWADGELVGERRGAAPQLNAQWGWMPLAPGDHTLVARAYNKSGDAGVAMVRVIAVEAADIDRDGVPDDEDACPQQIGSLDLAGCPPGAQSDTEESNALEDAWIAGSLDQNESDSGQIPGEGQHHTIGQPGSIQGNQQRPSFPGDSDLAPGQVAIEENCGLCHLLEQLNGEQVYSDVEEWGTGLEVEVLSLRTAEGIRDVSCYVRMQNDRWERAPTDQDQFLRSLGNGFWNISAYLGGEHGQSVTVMGGEPLRFQIRCLGRLGDMLTPSLHLGEVAREHGAADWNGQTFTAHGQQGANWFDVSYRICGIPCEEDVIPPPYDLQLRRNVGINTTYTLTWRWDGDMASIDGFKVYRDGQVVDFSGEKYAFLSQNTVEPPCSTEYRFEVRAYKDQQESATSNAVFSSSAVSCRNRNELTVANVWMPTPQRPVLNVELNYWYDGEEGTARVFVLPLQGGSVPGWPNDFHTNFTLNNVIISPEQGSATVTLVYGGDQQMTTNGLKLVMMDEEGEWFYWRDVPLNIVWYPSAPDLEIISVDSLNRSGGGDYAPAILVRNNGYHRLWWHADIRAQHPNGGAEILHLHDSNLTYVGPRETARILWEGWNEEQIEALRGTRNAAGNIISPGYEFVVDPDNVLAELNEGNNVFRGSLERMTVYFSHLAVDHVSIERPGGVVGVGGQLIVFRGGGRGEALGAVEFKGWAEDEWVGPLYAPHEEGVTLCPGALYRFNDIASVIKSSHACLTNNSVYSCGAYLVEQTEDRRCENSYTCAEGEDWATICSNLMHQGFFNPSPSIDFYYMPGETLLFYVYIYDKDVRVGFDGTETICDFSEEMPAELFPSDRELMVSSEEQGCRVYFYARY